MKKNQKIWETVWDLCGDHDWMSRYCFRIVGGRRIYTDAFINNGTLCKIGYIAHDVENNWFKTVLRYVHPDTKIELIPIEQTPDSVL